jgi:hypothetical protein
VCGRKVPLERSGLDRFPGKDRDQQGLSREGLAVGPDGSAAGVPNPGGKWSDGRIVDPEEDLVSDRSSFFFGRVSRLRESLDFLVFFEAFFKGAVFAMMAPGFYIGYTREPARVSPTAAKIRFLASCHEADNRESAIFDLFHMDVKHRHFATGTEVLVSGIQDALAVPPEIGRSALEEAALYKRERSLVYGVFFLVGRIEIDGKPRRLAAPLLHFPASLEREIVGGDAARYLNEISRPAEAALESSDVPTDAFLDRVSSRLSSSGFRVYRTFLVAGTIVDLLVEREGKVFGIDLIGQSGTLGAPLDLERYRMLRRAGLSVFPLSFASWLSNESSCLEAIERHPSLSSSGR